MIESVLASGVVLATPLVWAAIGGLVNRRGGIVNIGLEGMMLAGALIGAVVSGWLHTWVLGVLVAGAVGLVLGVLFSWTVTRLSANQILAGLGLNVVVAGTIGYVLRSVVGVSGSLRVEGLVRLPRIDIPLVGDVPMLGALVSGKDPLTWLAVVLVPGAAFVLGRSRWGLRLRATGAASDAAASLGLPVQRIRDASTAVAGFLAGVAGAHLSLGQVGLFNDRMVAGRGFIALAAFYFGRSRPWPTAAACLLFALLDAAQIRLAGPGATSQLLQTLPYLVVVVVLAITGIATARQRTRVTEA